MSLSSNVPAPAASASLAAFAGPLAVRLACRAGAHGGHTSGLAPGFVQANLVVLPADLAGHFLRFCTANPKPCPVLAVSEAGSSRLPELGLDLDAASDLPRYRVWRDGDLVDEPSDVRALWRDDLVTFAIGCSFTFEEALASGGLEARNARLGRNVPMYRTSIACRPAGPFHGPMVVSMRPFAPADAVRAVQITSRFPAVHGAPVHLGRPDLIGIVDLDRPDYGDPVPVGPDEMPVFWACGVTPQAAIAAAKPPFAITHAPGCMLVTDRRNGEYAVI